MSGADIVHGRAMSGRQRCYYWLAFWTAGSASGGGRYTSAPYRAMQLPCGVRYRAMHSLSDVCGRAVPFCAEVVLGDAVLMYWCSTALLHLPN
eukprot:945250-Rhodomonas_salina.1